MSPLDFIQSHADLFARVGAVVGTYRTRGQARFGPHYRLVYRENRRQRSLYIGRSEQLADRVRDLLKQLQQPRDHRRALERSRRERNARVRRIVREWKELIRTYGLYSHGYEIRGVRAAGFPRIDKGIPRKYPTSRRPSPATVVGHDCIVPSGTTRPATPAATPTSKGLNSFNPQPQARPTRNQKYCPKRPPAAQLVPGLGAEPPFLPIPEMADGRETERLNQKYCPERPLAAQLLTCSPVQTAPPTAPRAPPPHAASPTIPPTPEGSVPAWAL